MELISHLGLLPGPGPSFVRFVRKTWSLFIMTLFAFLAMAIQLSTFGCVFAAILWPSRVDVFQRWTTQLYWGSAIYFMHLNKVKVKITGDRIDLGSALLMANHQSLADHLVMAHLAQTTSTSAVPTVNFFSWYTLWTVPSLRLLLNMLACDENWELTKLMTSAVFHDMVLSPVPEWIVVFPEVNIWTPTTAYLQKLQGLDYFLPQFEHMLYPRFSAMYNAVSMAKTTGRSKFSTMYDVTISYNHPGAPTLATFFASLDPIKVIVHVKAHSMLSVPSRRKKLEEWIEKRWIEKDRRLTMIEQGLSIRERVAGQFV